MLFFTFFSSKGELWFRLIYFSLLYTCLRRLKTTSFKNLVRPHKISLRTVLDVALFAYRQETDTMSLIKPFLFVQCMLGKDLSYIKLFIVKYISGRSSTCVCVIFTKAHPVAPWRYYATCRLHVCM